MVVVGTVVVVGAGTEAVEKLGIAARCCRTQVTVAVGIYNVAYNTYRNTVIIAWFRMQLLLLRHRKAHVCYVQL